MDAGNVWHVSDSMQQASNSRQQTAAITCRQQPSDNRHQTASSRHVTKGRWQQVADIRRQATGSRQNYARSIYQTAGGKQQEAETKG